ncbi:PLDc_N domain-containing protein [Candidatus Woesearchaeota archaeon]|nr:PLDc_N domain-containing protein [Candidatus Woesearchaeota archaeon]
MAAGVILVLLLMFGSVLLFVFWIWMLIDCMRNGKISANERLIWVIVIVFLNFIGAVLYYFLGRGKQRENKPKKHSKRRK